MDRASMGDFDFSQLPRHWAENIVSSGSSSMSDEIRDLMRVLRRGRSNWSTFDRTRIQTAFALPAGTGRAPSVEESEDEAEHSQEVVATSSVQTQSSDRLIRQLVRRSSFRTYGFASRGRASGKSPLILIHDSDDKDVSGETRLPFSLSPGSEDETVAGTHKRHRSSEGALPGPSRPIFVSEGDGSSFAAQSELISLAGHMRSAGCRLPSLASSVEREAFAKVSVESSKVMEAFNEYVVTMEDHVVASRNDKEIESIDLDNMIKDILNSQLNEKFWDAMPTTKCLKRKNGVAASVVPNQRPSTKRRKDKEPADGGEASDMAADHNVAISGLADLVKILTAKIEGIDGSVADKVTKALDATIDSKVEARLRVYESDLRKQIAKLEAQINDSKNNADVNIAPDVATSKAYEDEDEDDGACSNDLKKINSQDGLPVDCVLKKEKKDKKTMGSTQNLTNKEVIKTEKKAGIPLRKTDNGSSFCRNSSGSLLASSTSFFLQFKLYTESNVFDFVKTQKSMKLPIVSYFHRRGIEVFLDQVTFWQNVFLDLTQVKTVPTSIVFVDDVQINDSKNNADVNIAPDVATSKAHEDEDDGACSNDLKKINSQDGLPVDCVLKKEKKDKKTMDSTQNLTNKEVIKTEKKAGIPLRKTDNGSSFCKNSSGSLLASSTSFFFSLNSTQSLTFSTL
ncbi:hypothetical protein F2Q69_00053163 [Brassica cretica]|uniref:Uncharacterized protein n=1 Tax=Brassica cretica TaxID=69181 RepID=A0A8S9MRG8_BRACR|nr:hypothetical protein F2Q69_00053163 [Brassica cretica]